MAMLQLLIIRNYSRRISCILVAYLLDIFDTGPGPTRPTQDGEFCDPTQPMNGLDLRPTLVCRSECDNRISDALTF